MPRFRAGHAITGSWRARYGKTICSCWAFDVASVAGCCSTVDAIAGMPPWCSTTVDIPSVFFVGTTERKTLVNVQSASCTPGTRYVLRHTIVSLMYT